MSEPSGPSGPSGKDPRKITTNRIILWVLVGGFAVYLIVSGIVGVVANG